MIEKIRNNARNILDQAVGKTSENMAAHAMTLLAVSACCAREVACQFNALYMDKNSDPNKKAVHIEKSHSLLSVCEDNQQIQLRVQNRINDGSCRTAFNIRGEHHLSAITVY